MQKSNQKWMDLGGDKVETGWRLRYNSIPVRVLYKRNYIFPKSVINFLSTSLRKSAVFLSGEL